MIKNVFGRKFSRDTNQRKALFKSLITSLIFKESIKTTIAKAKAIKGDVDKIVNKAKKKGNGLAVQLLQRDLGVPAINKVIKDIAPRFADRNSGYTRLTRLGRRFSDNADMVLMEWVIKSQNSSIRGAQDKTQSLDVKELSPKIEEKIHTRNALPSVAGGKKETIKSKESKRKVAKK